MLRTNWITLYCLYYEYIWNKTFTCSNSLKSTVENKTLGQNENKYESDLLSLCDTSNCLSQYVRENNLEEKDSELKQNELGNEFLPPQLLSDLLYGSTPPLTEVSFDQ